ncbi:MAG: hypothetical protein ACO1TE_01120 [Prosthecobacter sp.]
MSDKDIIGVRQAHVRMIVVTTVRKDGTKTVRKELEVLQVVDRDIAAVRRLKQPPRGSFSQWLRELMMRLSATGLYHWMTAFFESVKLALRRLFP